MSLSCTNAGEVRVATRGGGRGDLRSRFWGFRLNEWKSRETENRICIKNQSVQRTPL